jgi:hypothetical protein
MDQGGQSGQGTGFSSFSSAKVSSASVKGSFESAVFSSSMGCAEWAIVRALRMARAGTLLLIFALASEAHAADGLTIEVDARGDCPGETWFRERLGQRGVRGSVRASLGAETEGYAGEVEARTAAGVSVKRRLTGVACATVAEGLLVVAEVHLAGLSPASPPPSLPTPAPLDFPAVSSQPAPPAPPFVRFAVGVLGTADTVVTGAPAFGGGITAWASLGSHRMRGLALSVIYSRADVIEVVPVTHWHVRARADLIPFDVALGSSTTLGLALFVSGGALHVNAQVDRSTPGARSLWLTGAGLRLRQALGPVFMEAGVDATVAMTRRSFEVIGIDAPLFSLPLAGVATTLSVGLPMPR